MSIMPEPVSIKAKDDLTLHRVTSPARLAELTSEWYSSPDQTKRYRLSVQLFHPLTDQNMLRACCPPTAPIIDPYDIHNIEVNTHRMDWRYLNIEPLRRAWRNVWKEVPWTRVDMLSLDVFLPNSRTAGQVNTSCATDCQGTDDPDEPTVHIYYQEPPYRKMEEPLLRKVRDVCLRTDRVSDRVVLLTNNASFKSKVQVKCELDYDDRPESSKGGIRNDDIFPRAETNMAKLYRRTS